MTLTAMELQNEGKVQITCMETVDQRGTTVPERERIALISMEPACN